MPPVSLELAELAALSYIDPNFYAGNVQARILIRHGVTYICPAGSNDGKDWIQDLCSCLVPRDGRGMIFDGFADMADQTKRPFLDFIKSFPAPYEICGHSAGVPLGAQWACWMAEIGMKPRFAQFIAGPCVGGADWVKYYRSFDIPTVRVGLFRDPVADAYKDRGGVTECPTLWLDTDGAVCVREERLAGIFTQHPMNHYLRSIRGYTKAG